MIQENSFVSVIINADDFGISDGVCKAILELFEMTAISNTTIMVAAYDSIQRLRKWGVSNLLQSAGIHLQLTSGKPVSAISEVPSLVDKKSGNFLPKSALANINPLDVEIEWNRQVELGMQLLGGRPTHLDSHQGVHRLPRFFDIYLSIAAKFNIPVRGGIDKGLEKRRKDRNIPGSSYLIREWAGHFLGIEPFLLRIMEVTKEIKDGEIIEVVTHPGYSDDYLVSISSLNVAREHDLYILEQIAKNRVLSRNNIILVSYPSFKPVGGR